MRVKEWNFFSFEIDEKVHRQHKLSVWKNLKENATIWRWMKLTLCSAKMWVKLQRVFVSFWNGRILWFSAQSNISHVISSVKWAFASSSKKLIVTSMSKRTAKDEIWPSGMRGEWMKNAHSAMTRGDWVAIRRAFCLLLTDFDILIQLVAVISILLLLHIKSWLSH